MLIVSFFLFVFSLLPVSVTAEDLIVFAAASLTEAFTEIGDAFEQKHPGVNIVFNFSGSQVLRTQIEQGAPADIFAAANPEVMQALVESRTVNGAETFTHNQLVLLVASSSVAKIADFKATALPGRLLSIGNADVPFGKYTRILLSGLAADSDFGADFYRDFMNNVVTEESNVNIAVARVALGEVDASIVYQTDVTSAVRRNLKVIHLPAAHNPLASYTVAWLKRTVQRQLASAFVHFLRADNGQGILEKHGFIKIGAADG